MRKSGNDIYLLISARWCPDCVLPAEDTGVFKNCTQANECDRSGTGQDSTSSNPLSISPDPTNGNHNARATAFLYKRVIFKAEKKWVLLGYVVAPQLGDPFCPKYGNGSWMNQPPGNPVAFSPDGTHIALGAPGGMNATSAQKNYQDCTTNGMRKSSLVLVTFDPPL